MQPLRTCEFREGARRIYSWTLYLFQHLQHRQQLEGMTQEGKSLCKGFVNLGIGVAVRLIFIGVAVHLLWFRGAVHLCIWVAVHLHTYNMRWNVSTEANILMNCYAVDILPEYATFITQNTIHKSNWQMETRKPKQYTNQKVRHTYEYK
jgi:hypothetical protein